MTTTVVRLPGLPPYGAPAAAFPEEWGRLGREGVVVEFTTVDATWVGNFRPGLRGVDLVHAHPNNRDAIVIAGGDLWVVNPLERSAELALTAIEAAFEVHDPEGWVFSKQGLALARFGPEGLIWHTRRLSWDGFAQLSVRRSEVTGLAWSAIDQGWHPFRVDVFTGRSTGGSYAEDDVERWQTLAG